MFNTLPLDQLGWSSNHNKTVNFAAMTNKIVLHIQLFVALLA